MTGVFSAWLLVSAAAGIFVGRIFDRAGPRTLMIGGSLIGMLALVMVAVAPKLPVFFPPLGKTASGSDSPTMTSKNSGNRSRFWKPRSDRSQGS